MINIDLFLQELRNSADIQYNIFTTGSCFRLYCILKVIFPEVKPFWSDSEGHSIVKLGDKFYDIGGELKKSYVENAEYREIDKEFFNGYRMMKYSPDHEHKPKIYTSRYL